MTRLLLYCHNVTGLGHIARSAKVAAALRAPGRAVTLVTGCPFLSSVAIAPGIEVVTLPPAKLSARVGFEPFHAADGATDIIRTRQERILQIVSALAPHAVLVDHNPYGLGGELLPTLAAARDHAWPTRFIWGIPYFSGGPIGRPQPPNPRLVAAVRQYSSAIGYCDQSEWDEIPRVDTWAVPARRVFAGVVTDAPEPSLPVQPGLVTVVCGGGTSALPLINQVLAARRRLPDTVRWRIVSGPMADFDTIAASLAGDPAIEFLRAAPATAVIRDAQVVIARCGYNTAGVLMRTDRPIIFVPAHGASGDQLHRARRLAGRPGVWALSATSTAEDLAAALAAALASGPVVRDQQWLSGGAERAASWVAAEGDAVQDGVA